MSSKRGKGAGSEGAGGHSDGDCTPTECKPTDKLWGIVTLAPLRSTAWKQGDLHARNTLSPMPPAPGTPAYC